MFRTLYNTVNSPLTDTLVSGQLYLLGTPFEMAVLPPSQTLYLHISVNGHSLADTFQNKNWIFQLFRINEFQGTTVFLFLIIPYFLD